jgi:hypothetical protein
MYADRSAVAEGGVHSSQVSPGRTGPHTASGGGRDPQPAQQVDAAVTKQAIGTPAWC